MMNKKRIFLPFIILILLAGCQRGSLDSYYVAGRQKRLVNLAVVPFEDLEQPERARQLTADVRRELMARHRITLVPEAALEQAMRETAIRPATYLEPDEARRLGQQLGVDMVLTARIKEFRFTEEVSNVPLLWSRTRIIATYKVDLCLVKTNRNRQSVRQVEGKAELVRREIQLLYLGAEGNYQFISAGQKQKVKKEAFENLIKEVVKAIRS